MWLDIQNKSSENPGSVNETLMQIQYKQFKDVEQ